MPDPSVKTLRAPEYSPEEREAILDYLMALRSREIRAFLEAHDLAVSGTKPELRERVGETLEEGDLTHADLIRWVDRYESWAKQHVFLYSGPEGHAIGEWRDIGWVAQHLREHKVHRYLNAVLPLILPPQLRLSSILHTGQILRIVAVERRDYSERVVELDEGRETDSGEEIELRAYVRHVKRGLVTFEWDLTANNAMLQISQLPSGTKYEDVAGGFEKLVGPWLDLRMFILLGIRPSIARLHELEESGQAEARSHAFGYASPGGRRVTGLSPSSVDSMVGEAEFDDAMRRIRQHGVGHLGNFYWLATTVDPSLNNPLEREVHTYLVASKGRVAFPAQNTEAEVRYVLSRVRTLSV